MDEAERIAAKLTKAQQEALTRDPWSMMAQYEAGILEPTALGLLQPDAWGHALSPLGLRVRTILEARNAD